MDTKEVMKMLEEMSSSSIKNIYTKHGAQEPFFGVKVGDMKKIEKQERNNHDLAMELYNTGNSDAMYLAGLIADKKKVDRPMLDDWIKKASWYMVAEYTVPWLAADSGLGRSCGYDWINSKDEITASGGWAALASALTIGDFDEEDTIKIDKLLDRIASSIHKQPNRVRYTMNNFVIAVGSYVPSLTQKAKEVAKEIGTVAVNLGQTACKVPDALSYIEKVESMDRIGKTKAKARC